VPSGVVFSIRQPALKGGTLANRLAFLYHVEDAITDELRAQAKAKTACSAKKVPKRLKLAGRFTASVVNGRWASAALEFTRSWCGGTTRENVRAFTLDLKTNTTVKLSTFTNLSAAELRWATIPSLYATRAYADGAFGPAGSTLVAAPVKSAPQVNWASVPKFSQWIVTAEGLRVYIPQAGNVYAATASWTDIAAKPPLAAGHALRWATYALRGYGIVARIPAELAPVHVGAAYGAWTTADGGTSVQVEGRRGDGSSVEARAVAEVAAIAAGGTVTEAVCDGSTLTVRGHQADNPAALFLVRVEYGALSDVRVVYRYPAEAASWVEAWADETFRSLRHANLDLAYG
jgi:hypothetical protein